MVHLWMNIGSKRRPTLIRSGDEIRLGRLNFVYLEPSDLYTALVPDAES